MQGSKEIKPSDIQFREDPDGAINGFYVREINKTFVCVDDLKSFVVEVLLTNADNDPTKIACANDFLEFLKFIEEWVVTHQA